MIKELFEEGYQHGLRSTKLTDFRASFRMGFRQAQIEKREYFRKTGILCYPKEHIKIRSH